GESTDARFRGGTVRSSDEAPVMGVERRDCVIQFCRLVNQLCADNRKGGTVNRDKEGANRQNEVV
ncbi:hypothetical protein, partial [Mesotoga sp. Brook.08.YT.4.2.5.4.]|uniref:hypothetical protein n=1 Tax=Mesotoga sp. Brook.08.YT.4.2.5.4. TaxID=1343998 RepID=UPI000DD2D296